MASRRRTISYVVGFLFNDEMDQVILVKKKRPAWQAGLLNGVGGHIERGEQPYAAMQREFQEEAGVDIRVDEWHLFQSERFTGKAVVHFFYSRSTVLHNVATTMTDETIHHCRIEFLSVTEVVRNLTYLIPMAIAKEKLIPGEHLPLLPRV